MFVEYGYSRHVIDNRRLETIVSIPAKKFVVYNLTDQQVLHCSVAAMRCSSLFVMVGMI
jgi:hypothetical protein